MEIKEGYCYQISKAFTIDGVTFEPDEKIVTCRVYDEKVVFYKKCKDSEINELSERELSVHLDMTSGTEYFETCENCGCELNGRPNAGWGMSYVCGYCAQALQRELEY